MIHAYDKVYLEKARSALGRMFDFVVYDLQINLSEFINMFLQSSISSRFEDGEPEILVGKSGIEFAYEILDEVHFSYKRIQPNFTMNRSPEYWTGWALAYYQWYTSMSFQTILKQIPIQDIVNLYSPFHEMDIQHFVDKMNMLYHSELPHTNLKIHRQKVKLSQKELAQLSSIPLRTIQQYEQRQKNINKASVESLVMLSKVLFCDIEDLLEP